MLLGRCKGIIFSRGRVLSNDVAQGLANAEEKYGKLLMLLVGARGFEPPTPAPKESEFIAMSANRQEETVTREQNCS
jgi:hypothetical protein